MAAVVVLLACTIHAAQQRTWTDSTGRFSVEAELVEVKDGQAVLKMPDGTTRPVPLDRLSAADQQYVQEFVQQQAKAPPAAIAAAPVDTTGLNLTLPGTMAEPPGWLANDPSVPFDVKAFFQAPPPEENAAPLYILALSEFGSMPYFAWHVQGIDPEKGRGYRVRTIFWNGAEPFG
jgi:hypothetical protein